MHDSFGQHPFWTLALSLFLLSVAIYGTVTGRVSLRTVTYSRAKDPFYYWFALACYYGASAWLIVTATLAISN
jgi:hypothetical protein